MEMFVDMAQGLLGRLGYATAHPVATHPAPQAAGRVPRAGGVRGKHRPSVPPVTVRCWVSSTWCYSGGMWADVKHGVTVASIGLLGWPHSLPFDSLPLSLSVPPPPAGKLLYHSRLAHTFFVQVGRLCMHTRRAQTCCRTGPASQAPLPSPCVFPSGHTRPTPAACSGRSCCRSIHGRHTPAASCEGVPALSTVHYYYMNGRVGNGESCCSIDNPFVTLHVRPISYTVVANGQRTG